MCNRSFHLEDRLPGEDSPGVDYGDCVTAVETRRGWILVVTNEDDEAGAGKYWLPLHMDGNLKFETAKAWNLSVPKIGGIVVGTSCCVCSSSAQDSLNECEAADSAFVPYQDRSCTDIVWLVAFIASGFAMFMIYVNAGVLGADTDYIVHGTDYTGAACENFVAWASLAPFVSSATVCIDSCDDTLTDNRMMIGYETEAYLYYCLPTSDNATFDLSTGLAEDISDLQTVSDIILGSAFIAFVMALTFTEIVGKFGVIILVGSSVLAVGAGFSASYALYNEAQATYETGDETTAQWMEIGAYVAGAGVFVVAVLLFFMRRQLVQAVRVFQTARDCVYDVKSLILFPVFPFLFGMGYFLVWIALAVYVASVTYTVQETVPTWMNVNPFWDDIQFLYSREWDSDAMLVDVIYMFFHLLWFTQFCVYFNYLTMAGVVGRWYFTKCDQSSGNKVGLESSTVLKSAIRSCRFHLGSVALGSFIIAVVQFIRWCFAYIKEQYLDEEANPAGACIGRCVSCCLWCFECCLDKLSQNAFAWQAVYGSSFCHGACSSASILFANLTRTVAMGWVQGVLLFAGQVFVSLATAAIGALLIAIYYEVNSNLLPTLIIFMVATLVGRLFFRAVRRRN